MHFYPRSPCGERLVAIHYTDGALNFYPRSPCGERQLLYIISTPKSNFYPRSPCGERPTSQVPTWFGMHFYPRSPCGERRHGVRIAKIDLAFLSTLSLRRATCWSPPARRCRVDFYPRSPCGERHARQGSWSAAKVISIHALLAESDALRSPRIALMVGFLSTLSLRRATPRS